MTANKSINADLRLLNNTLMSYSNYQSGDWLPGCMIKLSNCSQNQKLLTIVEVSPIIPYITNTRIVIPV